MSGETLRREFGRPGSARFCAGRVTGRSGRVQAGPGPGGRHAILVQRHRRLGLSLTDRRGSLNRVAFASGTKKGAAALPPVAVSKDRHVPSHTKLKQAHPIFFGFQKQGNRHCANDGRASAP